MILSKMMLRIASATGGLVQGVATGGTTTTLLDSKSTETADKFTGGTIWFLSGTLINKWATIRSHYGTEYTFDTQTAAPVAGVAYAVAPAKFNADKIQQAILQSLAEWGDLLFCDKTLEISTSTRVYTLPTGVSDIRSIKVLGTDGKLTPNYNWEEQLGTLIFNRDPSVSGTAYIYYVAPHPDVSDTVEIDPLIDTQRLLHSSLANMYGMLVAQVGQNDKMFIELYNRETQIATNLARSDAKQRYRTPQRDPTLGW